MPVQLRPGTLQALPIQEWAFLLLGMVRMARPQAPPAGFATTRPSAFLCPALLAAPRTAAGGTAPCSASRSTP